MIYQANSVILLPQMLKAITENNTPQAMSSFKFIAVGGGKISADLLAQCREQKINIYEGYGLSECASVVSLNTPEANKIGSVGKPLPHVRLHISSSGELIVEGSKMLGYLNETKQTEDIETGDIAHIDDDGFLYITGRKKNLIISSFGRNISPEWVESSFLKKPQIQQIVVFGEAKPHLSAIIVAKKNQTDQSITQAVALVNKQLPDYAQVKQWYIENQPFCVANDFLTENGKLCRNNLQRAYEYLFNAEKDSAEKDSSEFVRLNLTSPHLTSLGKAAI